MWLRANQITQEKIGELKTAIETVKKKKTKKESQLLVRQY